ncbi:MAG TPA: WYL domain-containing protein [Planctomycetaceae bacterium]|nr:WYL domain-containing protein [Planctomycetaceae bacterium]
MSADRRLQRLLRCLDALQSGRTLSSVVLAAECRVSRRTIFRDLATLQAAGVSIIYDKDRQGYYLPKRTTLLPQELTVEEVFSLLLVCQQLGDPDSGLPFHSAARQAAQKILHQLPRKVRETAEQSIDSFVIRLDPHHPHDTSETIYRELMQALLQRRCARIRYQSFFDGGAITTLLSPYRFVYSRRAWYVIGRSSLHRAVRTFHLGRVDLVEVLAATYRIPPRFSLKRYFGLAWHLIRMPNERHEVVVHFRPPVAGNIAEVRWHATQELKWLDGGILEWRATLEGVQEVAWWILGYGRHATVIRPACLRAIIREHALAMAADYFETPVQVST